MAQLEIKTKGIEKTLRTLNKSTSRQAIAEYIWNGFDAGGTCIKLNYTCDNVDNIVSLSIADNGSGIDLKHIDEKFKTFYESKKASESDYHKTHSSIHGMNGVGRLTFVNFAGAATWETCYKDKDKYKSGRITISKVDLENYSDPVIVDSVNEKTGTIVQFDNFNSNFSRTTIDDEVIPFLLSEFSWFLELNKFNDYKILINGENLDYSSNILDEDTSISFEYEKSKTEFSIRYYQWEEKQNAEQSKIYFLDSTHKEVFKQFTTLNRKGDGYYHSVYVTSSFFDSFDARTGDNGQGDFLVQNRSMTEFKFIVRRVNEFLIKRRKPFLHAVADALIEKYEADKILPEYNNSWEAPRKRELCDTIRGFYEIQPQLFTGLSIPQKKVIVKFLDLLIDSNEKDRVFDILGEIVELKPEERKTLSEILKKTHLNNVIDTIKLIEDRYKAYGQLKEMVFNPSLKANEVDHLQSMIESHYWIFGEQYHLVTAAEPKFEEALRRYNYLLTENDEVVEIDHPHKLKEMDIFACRQKVGTDRIDNIVVELKHPDIKLGREQFNQVDKYLEVILAQPEFNASNMYWEFYLVGNKFKSDGFIERQIASAKSNGIPSLVQFLEEGRVKVYVKKWSEVFTEFEIKHKFLNDKLKLERNQIANKMSTSDAIVEDAQENSAIQPEEVVIGEA